MAASQQDEQRLALFIDFENIAIGVRDAHYRKFDINLVLERLLDKGKLLVKKAYADWSRYSDYKRSFHEAAIELIEVPQKSVGGKNSADIRLVVDAMDMSFQKEHINCFVVASGDSDFSPLVSKLKENNKYVIGLGVKNSTSDLLIENCDEFIFYEDLVRGQQRPLPQIANVDGKVQECFALLVDSILALQRENKEVLWGSMVKETMKRKKPSFNETYYGFRTFSHLLEDAQRRNIVVLRRDQKSGSYIVEDLGAAGTMGGRADFPQSAPTLVRAAAEPATASGAALLASPASVPANGLVAAAPVEGAEGTGVAKPRRGRGRGRGRRPRAGGLSSTGMPLAAQAGGEEGHAGDEGELDDNYADHGEHDDHDHDHDDDIAGAEGHEDENGHPHAEEPGHAEATVAADAVAPAEEEQAGDPAAGLPPSESSQPEADRGPFSFFSWMRRETQLPAEPRRRDEPEEH